MLIESAHTIPTHYQAQIDDTCDALAMVMSDEVYNTNPETALALPWTIHPTSSEAELALAAGRPCIISQTLGLFATVAH